MVTYVVRLDTEAREQWLACVRTGRAAAGQLLQARLVRKADVGAGSRRWTDAESAEALDTRAATGHQGRQDWVAWGLETALFRKRPTGRPYRQLDGAQEAQLIAVPCRTPPEGRVRWTRKGWADKLVALAIVDTISPACVRTTLKKPRSNRGRSSRGCSHRQPTPRVSVPWRTCWRSTRAPMMPGDRKCA